MPLQGDCPPRSEPQGVALGYVLLPLRGVLGAGGVWVRAWHWVFPGVLGAGVCTDGLKGQKLLAQGNALGICAHPIAL